MTVAQLIVAVAGYCSLAIAAGYSVVALIAAVAWWFNVSRRRHAPVLEPPVTVLKPLCGAEPGLYEQLRSFCVQDYAQFQIVFGTQDAADPALAVVARLTEEFPDLPIDVVVNPQRHGHNNKSNNLINMLAKARHPILLIADSDILVGPDYLATVTAPLQDPKVGLVTCLSHDSPTPRLWSRLGAMYNNEWYFPSVMLAWLFGHQGYASGQTLCLRRVTLEAIGGLRAFVDHLADDYRLGELVRAQGLRIVLSPYEIRARHDEPDFAALNRHELRWMRTLRVIHPLCLAMIFLTFSLPLATTGLLLRWAAGSIPTLTWVLFAATVLARLGLNLVYRQRSGHPLFQDILLIPLRDLLLFAVWCQCFRSRRVSWRGNEFDVDATGVMRRVA
jgi:ceramide glucosyltransferase